jgi:transcriptional regulator with PAS, ATPase and Fis domain
MYRINTITIEVPPLRERHGDIPRLADFFLAHYNEKYKKSIRKFGKETLNELEKYSWPGNVRELQHAIEKAVILSEKNVVLPGDLDLNHGSIQLSRPETSNLQENERLLISRILEKNNRNISLTSRELGINRSTLYEKMKKYDLR